MRFEVGDKVEFDPDGPLFGVAEGRGFWGLDPDNRWEIIRWVDPNTILIDCPALTNNAHPQFNQDYFRLACKRLTLDTLLILLREVIE